MRTNRYGVAVTRPHPMVAMLGPCPCQGCGTLVWWAHGQTRLEWNGPTVPGYLAWREVGGAIHSLRCPARKAA